MTSSLVGSYSPFARHPFALVALTCSRYRINFVLEYNSQRYITLFPLVKLRPVQVPLS